MAYPNELNNVNLHHANAQLKSYIINYIFVGDTCAVDIDECLSSPCGTSNTCEDITNGYTCQCGPGLTGTYCEEHIDFCEHSMCQHGATCSNTGIGYQCQCVIGFTGNNQFQ